MGTREALWAISRTEVVDLTLVFSIASEQVRSLARHGANHWRFAIKLPECQRHLRTVVLPTNLWDADIAESFKIAFTF